MGRIYFLERLGTCKFCRQWGLKVDCCEARGPFPENHGLHTYFSGTLGVHM
jgi:hypothetical protein